MMTPDARWVHMIRLKLNHPKHPDHATYLDFTRLLEALKKRRKNERD